VPRRRSRELRSLLLGRRRLVQMRTRLIKVMRGVLRQQQVTVRARAPTRARGGQPLEAVALPAAARQVVATYRDLVTATTTAIEGWTRAWRRGPPAVAAYNGWR
jgi:hypothetical protein